MNIKDTIAVSHIKKLVKTVCTLGPKHQMVCEWLGLYLEEKTRQGGPAGKAAFSRSRPDRGIHYQPKRH